MWARRTTAVILRAAFPRKVFVQVPHYALGVTDILVKVTVSVC
jgi:hypothetical protein